MPNIRSSRSESWGSKPGITDLATLEFRNEEELLLTAPDTEQFYLDYCVPRKIELNLAYAQRANRWEDTKIILRTLGAYSEASVADALGKPVDAELSRSPSAS